MQRQICICPMAVPCLQTVSPIISNYSCKNKFLHIRFHDLRHTAGSLLLEDGLDIKTIQEFLGHSEASTTANIFLHNIARGGHVTANALSRFIV